MLASEELDEHEQFETTVGHYMGRLDELKTDEKLTTDPGLVPLIDQVHNHLKHVTYGFRVAGDSNDMPYELPRTDPYPIGPTERAIRKASRLFDMVNSDEDLAMPAGIEFELNYGEVARDAQQSIVEKLLTDPMAAYDDFAERRRAGGDEALFPELGWTLKGLFYDMATKPEVTSACATSPILARLRNTLLTDIDAKVKENTFGYTSTLLMIEDAVAFFDIAVRTTEPAVPPPYHSARFEYNWHSLLEEPEHTLLPTMASVNAVDLMKIRGVPVGLVGVSTSTLRVDGFPQTPYEFFHHDVDHTRRMHEATRAAIVREGVTPRKYAEEATRLLDDVLLPAIALDPEMNEAEQDLRIAMRMTLFEILHEDGYDPTRDTIAEAILRIPNERTPFERTLDGNIIEYYMASRATTLAHVFRKLAHTFYDLPERRSTSLGTDFVRTRLAISQGAANLYRLVSDDPIEDEALLTTCRDLVSTDEGFTDAFLGNFAHDIKRRAVGHNALKLMVSRPLGVNSAIRRLGEDYKDQKIHSLFGYSALEYEDPDALEQAAIADLGNLDPNQTIIAIGATPYGIGRLYPIAKELGFMTLGIVSSTAVGRNEECAEGVDAIVVVKDTEWGGFRYGQQRQDQRRGLLSPTTRVFVGASDSIAAYGGGNITAVSIEEMWRRDKPVSFKPFDMNHNIADMMQGQRGDGGSIDYRGPAYAKWQELLAAGHVR